MSYVRQATVKVVCPSSTWPSIGTLSFFEIACLLLHNTLPPMGARKVPDPLL